MELLNLRSNSLSEEAVTMRRMWDKNNNDDDRRNVNGHGVKEVGSAIVKGWGWHTLQTGLSVSNG